MRNIVPIRKLLGVGIGIIAIVVIGFSVRSWLDSALQRKIAIREIEQLGGTVYVEHSAPGGQLPCLSPMERLANFLVGEKAIDGPANIFVDVHLKKIAPRIGQIGMVRNVTVFQNGFDESDIDCLGQLRNVSQITLLSFRDNRAAARNLHRLLPNCTIVVPPQYKLENDDGFRRKHSSRES